jgi:hypothetical protein
LAALRCGSEFVKASTEWELKSELVRKAAVSQARRRNGKIINQSNQNPRRSNRKFKSMSL